jgi:hypothetical protein
MMYLNPGMRDDIDRWRRPEMPWNVEELEIDLTLRQWRRTWTLIGKRWAETFRWNMRLHLVDVLDLPISTVSGPPPDETHPT